MFKYDLLTVNIGSVTQRNFRISKENSNAIYTRPISSKLNFKTESDNCKIELLEQIESIEAETTKFQKIQKIAVIGVKENLS